MARIQVTCSDCGDVELRSNDIRICLHEGTYEAQYLFRCPRCCMLEAKCAREHIVEILLVAGCEQFVLKTPAELFDPLRTSASSKISHDDVMDFHSFLLDNALVGTAMGQLRETFSDL